MIEDKKEMSDKKRMKPIAAIIWGVLCPGLGQVYTKRYKYAFILCAAFLVLTLSWVYLGFIWFFTGMAIFTIIKYGLYGYALIEAFLYSRKADKQPANTFQVIGMGIFFWALLFTAIFTSPYKAYRMPSGSMSPTMEIGDNFVVNKNERSKANANRRTIIAFHDPQGSSKLYIKRIVAIAGDNVEIRNDSLYVNSTYVQESLEYFKQAPVAPSDMKNVPKRIVQLNSVYVLGDNRCNSIDSRYYGDIPICLIVGIPQYVYWGKSIKRMGINLKKEE